MSKKNFLTSLTGQIFFALLLGALIGIANNVMIPDCSFKNILNETLFVVGESFIRLMQMLVLPLVFCSIIHGNMSMEDTSELGKIGSSIVGFYIITTIIAVFLAVGLGYVLDPGAGLDLHSVTVTESMNLASNSANNVNISQMVVNIIPTNIFAAFTSGTILQVLFFAMIISFVMVKIKSRVEVVRNLFEQLNDIMTTMTKYVMKFAPIGVLCLTAQTFTTTGLAGFIPLLKFVAVGYLILAIHVGVVYLGMFKFLTGLNPLKFIRKFFPVGTFAFSTASSNATIPLNIKVLEEDIGVSKRISSFTIPLGATINMDGSAIIYALSVIFVASAYNIDLSLIQYLTIIGVTTLASIGTAGIPGIGLLIMVFNSVGLPLEAIGIIMGVDRIVDMGRTAVNVTGDAICTTIIAKNNNALNIETFNNMDKTE